MANNWIIVLAIGLIAIVLLFVFGTGKLRPRGIHGGHDFGFGTINPNLTEGGFLNPY